MRFILLQLILVATPFVLYRLYIAFVMRRKLDTEGRYNEVPLGVLLLAGLALAAVGLVVAWSLEERKLGDYTPAKYEDGEIVPPRID